MIRTEGLSPRSRTRLLPGAVSHEWDWQKQGACREMGTPTFFAYEDKRGRPKERAIAIAKAVCASCPVLTKCREFGLETKQEFGIWGGLTIAEREDIWKKTTAS